MAEKCILKVQAWVEGSTVFARVLEQDEKKIRRTAYMHTAANGFLLKSVNCPAPGYGVLFVRGDWTKDDTKERSHSFDSPTDATAWISRCRAAVEEIGGVFIEGKELPVESPAEAPVEKPVVAAETPAETPAETQVESGVIETQGEKRVSPTGATRQNATGKGRPTLISPVALRELSIHFEQSAAIHGDRNWEKGLKLCEQILDSLHRHVASDLMGDTSEDHARAIAWNAMAYLHTRKMIEAGLLPAELDDRPLSTYRKEATA